MKVREGDRVLVNIAPFIGVAAPSGQSVPCRVVAIRGADVQVCPEPPLRGVCLWVGSQWIDNPPVRRPQLLNA